MPFKLEVGDIVMGRISKIDDDYVYVSTGFKTEGKIPTGEFRTESDGEPRLRLDDEVEVMVMEIDDEEISLSYKKVVEQKRWNEITKAHEQKEPINGTILKPVKGGYRVDVGVNTHAFMPTSHLGFAPSMTPAELTGKELRLKILELDSDRGNIVVSHKEQLRLEADKKEKEFFNNLGVGKVVPGRVTRLTNFGAFVDIGGIEGLVHVSEISWVRLKHPSEMLKTGQEIQVKILDVDPENKRISLSIRKTEADPWEQLDDRLKPGEMIEGTVTKVAKFGLFVRILDKYEGLAHASEMGELKPDSKSFPAGRKVKVRVLHVDQKNHKIALGLHMESKVSSDQQKYIDNGKPSTTLGDMLGDKLDAPAD